MLTDTMALWFTREDPSSWVRSQVIRAIRHLPAHTIRLLRTTRIRTFLVRSTTTPGRNPLTTPHHTHQPFRRMARLNRTIRLTSRNQSTKPLRTPLLRTRITNITSLLTITWSTGPCGVKMLNVWCATIDTPTTARWRRTSFVLI